MHSTLLHYPEDSFRQTGEFTRQFSVYKYPSWRMTEGLLRIALQEAFYYTWTVTRHETPSDTTTVKQI